MSKNTRNRTLLFILGSALAAMAVYAVCSAPEPHDAESCPAGSSRAAKQNICIQGSCGNGTLDTGEACDDGNRIAGDGCSPDCQSTEVCGNGVLDDAVGEVCDDGNTAPDDHCCSDCRSCPDLAAQPLQPSSPEPDEQATEACSQTQLQQALAEASAAHARAEHESARASQEAERARMAMQHAARQSCPGGQANRVQANKAEELRRALRTITELERANAALEQALEAERLQLANLRTRMASGRSDELQ